MATEGAVHSSRPLAASADKPHSCSSSMGRDDNYVWPYNGPGVTKPAQSYHTPRRVPQTERRNDSGGQSRSTGPVLSPYEAHKADMARSSPSRSPATSMSPYEQARSAAARTSSNRSPAPSPYNIYQSTTTRSSSPRGSTPPRRHPDTWTWKQKADAEAAASDEASVYPTPGAFPSARAEPKSSKSSTGSLGDETIGVEVSMKLMMLHDALVSCLKIASHYDSTYRRHAGGITWAQPETLDSVWRDLIANHDGGSFLQAANDLKNILDSLKTVLGRSNANEHNGTAWKSSEVIQYRLRTARRVGQQCEELMEGIRRATMTRTACQILASEIRDVVKMLDPATHPMLAQRNGKASPTSTHGKTHQTGAKRDTSGQNGGSSSPKRPAPSRNTFNDVPEESYQSGAENASGAWGSGVGDDAGNDGGGYGNPSSESHNDISGNGSEHGSGKDCGWGVGGGSRDGSRTASQNGSVHGYADESNESSEPTQKETSWGADDNQDAGAEEGGNDDGVKKVDPAWC